MIDSNELGGFITHCTNVDFLLDLRNHLDDRLRALGAFGRKPRQMEIIPGTQDGRVIHTPESRVPKSASAPPTPPVQPVPDQAGEVERAEPNILDKIEEPKSDGKRIVVGGTLYVVDELTLPDSKQRAGFTIRGLQGGGKYIVLEKENHALICDCPDFIKRRKADKGLECKHTTACRVAFKVPEVVEAPQEAAPPVQDAPAEKAEAPDVPVPATAPEVE